MSGFRQSVVRWFLTTKKTPPVTVVSGRNTADKLYADILRKNCKAAFIITSKTVRNKGMLDKLTENLTANGIKSVFFSDIVPDPTIENVERGLSVYRENKCDCVIAVGGGSVLDCAKVIALRAANPHVSVKMMSLYVVPCKKSVPIFAVPTTSGTGSEITFFSVITDAKKHKKLPLLSDRYLPEKIVFDSALLENVPQKPTVYAGLDALTHCIEAFISTNAKTFAEDVVSAHEVCRDIFAYLPVVAKEPRNEEARLKMAEAAYKAGLNFRRTGVGFVHAIAHRLGETYHIPHGLACAAVLPHVLEKLLPEAQNRLKKLAVKSGTAKSAEAFIEKIRALERTLGIPEKFAEINERDFPVMIRRILSEAATQGCPKRLDAKEIETILKSLKAD